VNILLIGLRGSGKSSIGPRLAALLGRTFIELDLLTAARLGATTAGEGLRVKGDAAFRAAETESLREALTGQDRVIALGGGTPTAPGAADLIRQQQLAGLARVIYLRASGPGLRERLAADPSDRPSLTGADPLVEIEAVLAVRDPLYLALSDDVVLVEHLTLEDSVQRVHQRVIEAIDH
jgi:shikimate kinase